MLLDEKFNMVDKNLHNKIVDSVILYMENEEERKALVQSALWGSNVLTHIEWNGSSKTFTNRLISKLIEFGTLEGGELAIVALLTKLKAEYGEDRKSIFEDLIREIYLYADRDKQNIKNITTKPTTVQARAYLMGIGAYYSTITLSESDKKDTLVRLTGHCAELGLPNCDELERLSQNSYLEITRKIQNHLSYKHPSAEIYFNAGIKLPLLFRENIEGWNEADIQREISSVLQSINIPPALKVNITYTTIHLDKITAYFWSILRA